MTVNGSLPAYTVTYTGFMGTENAGNAALTIPAAVTCTADGKTAGSYAIAITTQAELNDTVGKNYEIKSQSKGILTVSEPEFIADALIFASAAVETDSGETTAETVSSVIGANTLNISGKISNGNR